MVMRRVIERENWSGVSNFNSRHAFSDRTLGLRGPLAWPAVLKLSNQRVRSRIQVPSLCVQWLLLLHWKESGKDQLKTMSEAGRRQSGLYGWGPC